MKLVVALIRVLFGIQKKRGCSPDQDNVCPQTIRPSAQAGQHQSSPTLQHTERFETHKESLPLPHDHLLCLFPVCYNYIPI
jgi:hypothetical protein